jgi:hypothetical protein
MRDAQVSVVGVRYPEKVFVGADDDCDAADGDDVFSHSRMVTGPAEPCCAAALPAADAAGVDVLYLLDLPICRPA